MHALNGERQEKRCNRCGHTIPLFTPHLQLTMSMQNGTMSTQTYCAACCDDPALAILFRDVMMQPVKRMVVKKVWS